METKAKKRQVSLYITESLWDYFQVTANVRSESMSEVVEVLIRDYCVLHKQNVNESIVAFWGLNENNDEL